MTLTKAKKNNYMHLIGVAILVASLLFAVFCVPWVFVRTLEMVKNLFESLKYYFLTLVFVETSIPSGIGSVSSVDYKIAFPVNWEEFKESFSSFWKLFKKKNWYCFQQRRLSGNIKKTQKD